MISKHLFSAHTVLGSSQHMAWSSEFSFLHFLKQLEEVTSVHADLASSLFPQYGKKNTSHFPGS